MKRVSVIILMLFPLLLFSQELKDTINIHFYPHSLSPQDSLRDGSHGKIFYIQEDTFFIWVDLFPGMFFVHETAYIFITKENVRIERGSWWPELNGRTILYGQQNKTGILSPFKISY